MGNINEEIVRRMVDDMIYGEYIKNSIYPPTKNSSAYPELDSQTFGKHIEIARLCYKYQREGEATGNIYGFILGSIFALIITYTYLLIN